MTLTNKFNEYLSRADILSLSALRSKYPKMYKKLANDNGTWSTIYNTFCRENMVNSLVEDTYLNLVKFLLQDSEDVITGAFNAYYVSIHKDFKNRKFNDFLEVVGGKKVLSSAIDDSWTPRLLWLPTMCGTKDFRYILNQCKSANPLTFIPTNIPVSLRDSLITKGMNKLEAYSFLLIKVLESVGGSAGKNIIPLSRVTEIIKLACDSKEEKTLEELNVISLHPILAGVIWVRAAFAFKDDFVSKAMMNRLLDFLSGFEELKDIKESIARYSTAVRDSTHAGGVNLASEEFEAWTKT